MFNKLSLLALATPLVHALTLNIPENPTSGGPVTISWATQSGDPPTFSIELTNEAFHRAFAIANNVQPEQGSIDLILPVVPVGQAVDIGNINNVYAQTGEFAVGPNAATTVTSVSQTSTTATSANGSSTRSASAASTPVTTRLTTSSAFGTTVTSPATSNTASSTAQQAAATSTFGNGTPAKFNVNMNTIAAALLSAIAGAAIVL
ncbi:hypothetical protein H0H87_007240 [Tephrocybe sp. NHM501043]|nr:hypothetical protein H0H87_007240 [Tephrocybe sp. NHM501043]